MANQGWRVGLSDFQEYHIKLEIVNLGYMAFDMPRLDRALKVKEIPLKYSKISCIRVVSSIPIRAIRPLNSRDIYLYPGYYKLK